MSAPAKPVKAACLSALPGISHGFFTRHGGVSGDVHASLNCGLGSQDATLNVEENRAIVAKALGAADLITAFQVHSNLAVIADQPWPRGAAPKADALVTATKGLALGVLSADCTPVLFADLGAGVIAAAHAGWRGATSGVLEATVTAMMQLGAAKLDICAGVGPCINQGAYEVGPQFEAEILALDAGNARFFARPAPASRPHFDLPGYIVTRLQHAGIGVVEAQSRCTFENESDLFSYRRSKQRNEADYGRQISAIVLI